LQGTVSVRSRIEAAMTLQGELTTRQLGERLVKLARIRAGLAPVLGAARATVQQMEELYRDQNVKDPIYHDMRAIVGPLERLAQRVDEEIERQLKRLEQPQIPDLAPDIVQNVDLPTPRIKRKVPAV